MPFDTIQINDIGHKKKSILVAEAILEAIEAGEYLPGSKLPSERTLATRMGVSRTAVREALSALQITGILLVRTAEGAYICNATKGSGNHDQAVLLLEESDSPLEVWIARKEIETTLTLLACTRASQKDLRHTEAQLAHMAEAAGIGDYEDYLYANDTFHRALILPVGNSVLVRIADGLLERTNQLLTKAVARRYVCRDLQFSLEKHQNIFQAYRERNHAVLQERIRNHFDELAHFHYEE